MPKVDKEKLQAETQYQQELVTKAQIRQHEKKMKKQLAMQERLLKVSSPIIEAGSGLCSKMGAAVKQGCFFEFELAEEGGVNAYADGKKIVVMPGMMQFAKTDEELAVVLGHEYAHNVMGHIASSKKNSLLGQLAGSLLDGLAATQGINTQGGLGKLGSYAGVMRFSKEFEKEADYIGLYITALAGYDIKNAPNLWRRMSLENEKAVYTATTHPTNPERYLILEKVVAEITNKKRNATALMPNLKTDG